MICFMDKVIKSHPSSIFLEQAKITYPIICGAMYPCSNPELIAAVSEAGGLGIVQPLSLTYVHGYSFREGLKFIKSLTKKPFGINVIVEQSSPFYEKKAKEWVEIGLEEGCHFFITALGNPDWVVKRVKANKGFVYHDVTDKRWALKALDKSVDGLVCVNNRAGGHAGTKSSEELFCELSELDVPLICAGGIGNEQDILNAKRIGYSGVQMGTRFIATLECSEKDSYKQAILKAHETDIVLTEKVTGIPLSVINTPFVQATGTKAGPLARFLLKKRWTKHLIRLWYGLRSIRKFKKASLEGLSSKGYWQAGKSVQGIHSIEAAQSIVKRFGKIYLQSEKSESTS
ncbi:2-nitropropane dioxygenase [Chlamydiales bacterium STE3]|nr:2-nitropropane dioxygenase [Chlamydiales bacterium STE3]